jgi:hypothetical protein
VHEKVPVVHEKMSSRFWGSSVARRIGAFSTLAFLGTLIFPNGRMAPLTRWYVLIDPNYDLLQLS